MKNSILLSLLPVILTTQTAWAACTGGLDMNGNSIINATMNGIEEKSPVITTDYVKKILSGNNGFSVSEKYHRAPAASWYDAMAYCEALESPERNSDDSIIYTDWRLPSASEMFSLCKQDGVFMQFHEKYEPVKLKNQKNNMNTMVIDTDMIDTKYYRYASSFCRRFPDDTSRKTLVNQHYGIFLRDVHYTYDGFDSKFFSQDNKRGRLTTNYSIVSSFEPHLSHVMKAPLPFSPEINTKNTLHAYCVR